MKQSDTKTIISAMRILSVEIQSGDNVANMAISEAADRLQGLYIHNTLLKELNDSQLQTIDALKKRLEGLTALSRQLLTEEQELAINAVDREAGD